MKNRSVLFALLISRYLFAAPYDTVQTAESLSAQPVFHYEAITGESGNSQVYASGDSINIELYYVEQNCGAYEYRFRSNGDSLIIEHVYANPRDCTEEEVFGLIATISGLAARTWLLELHIVGESATNSIFGEYFKTGKKHK